VALRLKDFDAVTFDVYGTLIDWEPAIGAFLGKWAVRNSIAASEAELVKSFDKHRAQVQKDRPAHLYPEVLRRCLDRIAADFGTIASQADRDSFGLQPHEWPAFEDSHAGLKELQRHVKIGTLTNIDNASYRTSCKRMDIEFDVNVTAERVGAYKPDWPHFETGLADFKKMGIPLERILHVGQSPRADIVPANKLGLKCIWVNRPNRSLALGGEGSGGANPDLTVSTLSEMVAALQSE
jgi:2-haloacid dehalogenase